MLDWERLKDSANADGEFRLHARFWTGTLKIANGEQATRIDLRDGAISAIEPWFASLAGDLSISASAAEWEALLASTPKPFYQDLYAATIHHGFTATGNRTHFCAYYPALRRLVELMRDVKNSEA
ncbi:MAG: hypothetical protein OXG51_02130 [Gammaproteobacteria bacterium]|nr:hypothetical protein [Gammaproteobacteria bacterium]